MSERQFDAVEVEGVRSSYYDMSHDHKYTSKMAELVPVLMEEALPGDTWKIRPEIFQRFAPLIAPVMHKIDNFMYMFYVPNRLIWRSFNDFIKNSSDTTTFNDNKTYVPPVAPYFTLAQLVSIYSDSTKCEFIDVISTGSEKFRYCIIPKSVIKLLENIGVPVDLITARKSTYRGLIESAITGFSATNKGIVLGSFDNTMDTYIVGFDYYNNQHHYNWWYPTYSYSTLKISSLPLRAYFKIWFEWFRDKNLESVAFDFDQDGQETNSQLIELLSLRTKCWEHDYFTSALPDPQRGPDVALQVAGTKGDVTLKPAGDTSATAGLWKYKTGSPLTWTNLPANSFDLIGSAGGKSVSTEVGLNVVNSNISGSGFANFNVNAQATNKLGLSDSQDGLVDTVYDPNGSLEVDFTNAQLGFTINQLRYQSTLQRFYELFARIGNRIKEWIGAVFDVNLSDARAMLTEYCGGNRAPVQVSSVEQTSQSDSATEQYLGQLGGRAQSSAVTTFNHYCPEHGFVVVLQCTLPRTSYMQMLRTKFTRRTYLDYCIPMFQSLGEQEVKKHEIYFDSTSDVNNESVFGYQARYQDYKYIPDMVAGDFLRSLNFYTLARHFDSAPSLNADFTKAQPSDRIFCVQDGTDTLWNDMYFDISLNRKLAYYSLPKID